MGLGLPHALGEESSSLRLVLEDVTGTGWLLGLQGPPSTPLTTLGHLRFPRCLPSLEGDDLTSAWHEERRKKDLE